MLLQTRRMIAQDERGSSEIAEDESQCYKSSFQGLGLKELYIFRFASGLRVTGEC